MKYPKSAFMLVLTSAIAISGQDTAAVGAVKKFVAQTFVLGESNPIYKPGSDSINAMFQKALSGGKTCKCKPPELMRKLYDNANALYDDTPDIRRYTMRRSMIFATLALCADEGKWETFIEYAKFSLRNGSKIEDLLEEQYCGLIMLDVFLGLKHRNLKKENLAGVRAELDELKNQISATTFSDAEKILGLIETGIEK